MEAELIFPYTNRQLALVLEPTYQYFHDTGIYRTQEIAVQLNTVEFPVGIRYYFFHKKPVKVFIDGFFIPGFCIKLNSTIKIEGSDIGVSPRRSIAAGVGISWKRFGAEFRAYTNRDVINTWLTSKYARFAIILGFQLF